ncbi:MAG: hypothetical protein AAFU67_16545, partial [Bacteroidota bacterium]
MVRSPSLDSLETSFKSLIPFVKETKIKGTAISLSKLMKMSPIGLIQSRIKDGPPGNLALHYQILIGIVLGAIIGMVAAKFPGGPSFIRNW